MSDLELQQVQLRLTRDPEVLSALKMRKQLKKEANGEEYVSTSFNSIELRFHKGEVKTLGKSIADSIHQRFFVIVGDDLTGRLAPVLDVVNEYSLGEVVAKKQGNVFDCPVCQAPFHTAGQLAFHLNKEHTKAAQAEKEKDPEQVEDDEDLVAGVID
jgi:uncharacterized C2H2 Zn-finger protein